MLQPYANCRPRRGQRKPFRPLENHNGRLGEQVFHAERFEIVKTFNAIQVTVKNWLRLAIGMKQSEGRTGHVVLASCAKPAHDAFGQRSFPASEVAGKKYQGWRFQAGRKSPAPGR